MGGGVRSEGSPGGVGDSAGSINGLDVGIVVGEPVGDTVGDAVGETVGDPVGDIVGVAVTAASSTSELEPLKPNIAGNKRSPAAVEITIFLNIYPPVGMRCACLQGTVYRSRTTFFVLNETL